MIGKNFIKEIECALNEKIVNINKINSGYSRDVYEINNKYILKIVYDARKEEKTLSEIDLLENNKLKYIPTIVYKDISKEKIPYIYYIERKIPGDLLLYKWSDLSSSEQRKTLDQLINIICNFHSIKKDFDYDNCLKQTMNLFDYYLNRLVDNNMLSSEKIKYLNEIKNIIPTLMIDAKIGLIHGDLHFNNLLMDNQGQLKMIDFETAKASFVEEEYDPIRRMSRNPNSFVQDSKIILDEKKYTDIMNYIMHNSSEVSDNFSNRLLFYDLMNSLRWLYKYPTHKAYNEIIFNKSKDLL